MKKIINVLTVGILLLTFASSCKKNDDPKPDVEAPTIEFAKPSLDGSTAYSRGFSMDFSATFRDNKALKQCVVTISYNPEVTTSMLKGIGSPWTPVQTEEQFSIEFDGEKEKVVSVNLFDDDIEIACLSGSYTLTFAVEDESENKFTTTVDITIE